MAVGGLVLGFQALWRMREGLISPPILAFVAIILLIILYFSPRYRKVSGANQSASQPVTSETATRRPPRPTWAEDCTQRPCVDNQHRHD
jgi:hypothetical protein